MKEIVNREKLLFFINLPIDLYDNGYYPLIIDGQNIKSIDVREIKKKCIKAQYGNKQDLISKYSKIDKSKRVILIDNFDNSPINKESKEKLIDKLCNHFENIVISVKEANEVHQITESEKLYADFRHFKIIPLGYLKRDELIDKWIRLGQDELTMQEGEIVRKLKITFDTVSNLLGEQLIPAYPFFILTPLQSLDSQ
ncbi:hypothetical protein [Labilibaculum euxinus]|uniref:Uncharacterized protein n=1 Tax=Labilibaculum euxinus TaxID=2686357 RepID=A0A7M4D1A1_9BACT|nr:hypothetical protein [Labilibaculum euxinus]MUP36430.1 hypothetical protein [Labilibaculum euxinus]MVB05635.1 hypothetical protein [Labilibaculum euxinus]